MKIIQIRDFRAFSKGWALGKLNGCEDDFDPGEERFCHKEVQFQ